jgi:hypothetical protein
MKEAVSPTAAAAHHGIVSDKLDAVARINGARAEPALLQTHIGKYAPAAPVAFLSGAFAPALLPERGRVVQSGCFKGSKFQTSPTSTLTFENGCLRSPSWAIDNLRGTEASQQQLQDQYKYRPRRRCGAGLKDIRHELHVIKAMYSLAVDRLQCPC